MNTVDFFGHKLTKLIIGDNPMSGHSYIEDKTTGQEMKEYYTAENMKAAFKHLEELGFNAMLPLADPYMIRLLKQHQDAGGELKFIWQPYMPMKQDVSMRQMNEVKGTIGIYHQGTTTDFLYERGEIEKIKENIKMWRELGTPVGLASHYPEVIARCEEENWGVDFYLASLHNARRGRRGEPSGFLTGKSKNISFYPQDRKTMLDLLKQLDKPIIAYKIFAGGQMFMGKTPEEKREIIKGVYEEVFSVLKSNDLAAIGVFQRDMDELKEDYDLYMEWYNEKYNK